MLKPKWLFVQLNIILPWSGARREGEIQFSLFVHFCLSIFGWHFRGTKHSENKTNQMKRTLRKISRFRKMTLLSFVEYYVFSVSLTGIVKLPLFKRWIRVSVTGNKLLVCFLVYNFVTWCIFFFPIFLFCIKVAGAQTCSSRENPRPPALSDSPEVVTNW